MSALLRLYNLKAKHKWSDKFFSKLLSLLGELLPKDNEMSSSFYATKKTSCSLGMPYEKYMHFQMIAYYIVRNLKIKFHVQCVVCQDGKRKEIMTKLGIVFLLNNCGTSR